MSITAFLYFKLNNLSQAKKGTEDGDLAEALEQTKALKIKEEECKKNQKEAAKEAVRTNSLNYTIYHIIE